MTCALRYCTEPRPHGLPVCEAHWSLVDAKTKGRFQYALSQLLKSPTDGEKFKRCADRLREAREDVTTAINEALKAREEL